MDSDYFPCNVGVRQGENLSPLLFSIYLNDLKDFIRVVSFLVYSTFQTRFLKKSECISICIDYYMLMIQLFWLKMKCNYNVLQTLFTNIVMNGQCRSIQITLKQLFFLRGKLEDSRHLCSVIIQLMLLMIMCTQV